MPTTIQPTTYLNQLTLRLRRLYRRLHRRLLLRNSNTTATNNNNGILSGIPTTTTKSTTFNSKNPKQSPTTNFNAIDILLPTFLFLLSLLLRLYDISRPSTIVFDELHFGRFVKRYRDKQYFFDIHPPLAKLILYFISLLFCNEPTLDYKHVGVPYGETKYTPLRITNAIFGSATTPIIYFISKQLGLSTSTSLLAAWVQSIDNMYITETRMILLEGQLLFFMSATLLSALKLWNSPPNTTYRYIWLGATAVMAANALSIKWTTLATPALIAIVSITGSHIAPYTKLLIPEMIAAGSLAIAVYMLYFYIHFRLLPLSGDGDAFMPISFQATLKNNEKYYDPEAAKPSFLRSFIYLNKEMFKANRRIKAKHPYQSSWFSWILNRKGVLFHMKTIFGGEEKVERIYLIVNPVVSVVCFGGILLVVGGILLPKLYKAVHIKLLKKRGGGEKKMKSFGMIRNVNQFHFNTKSSLLRTRSQQILTKLQPYMSPKLSSQQLSSLLFLTAGYLTNLLPYYEVSRCTFLYHFIPALFYNQLLLAQLINLFPKRGRRWVVGVLMLLMGVAFLVWMPWIYGGALTEDEHDWRVLPWTNWM